MHTTLSRRPQADHPVTAARDTCCCDETVQCIHCRAKADEARAARRDAVIHSLALVRQRRGLR